jgi:peptidyl-prolyl cis-trans isomerase SurA
MRYRFFLRAFFSVILAPGAFAQAQNIDKTIGIVGKHILLRSALERELKTLKGENIQITDSVRCAVYEELMFQKLLLAQADKDSVTVKDEQIDYELDRRMAYFINQFGSEEAFENYYQKSVKQYKEELRDDVKDLLVAQQMQGKIVGDVKVSPADVRAFFHSIPEDSLPTVNTEVELGQLVKKPEVSEAAKKAAREKLEGYRQRVLNGESMAVIATLYTEDPGSAKTGGRYDGIARGMFVPEFEAVAFRLKPGEVSEIFSTSYGLHFIQLIQRRGELVDVRHILITPKISVEDEIDAKVKLDSIYEDIRSGKISFCEAAQKFSDDKDTRNNCGLLLNNQAGSTRFEIDELGQQDQNLVFMLDKMQMGDISKPVIHTGPDGSKKGYRIIYLKSRTEPHKINLKDDYQRLQNMAIMEKQKRLINEWINKKLRNVYVRMDPEYKACRLKYNWRPHTP